MLAALSAVAAVGLVVALAAGKFLTAPAGVLAFLLFLLWRKTD